MNIGIANDHHGVYLKHCLTKYLKAQGYNVINYGSDIDEPVDFTDYAVKLGNGIKEGKIQFGISICGTGIGMSIALNKMKGIYCAKVANLSEAMLSRAHNDVNVIAISEDLDETLAGEIVKKFIETPFSNIDKYLRRNNFIKELEND